MNRNTVVHPPHYNAHPSGVECVEIAEWLGFNLGNAFKYRWRAGLKHSDRAEEHLKALWYVRRELHRRRVSNGMSALIVPEHIVTLLADVANVRGSDPMLLNIGMAATGEMSLAVLEEVMVTALRRDGVQLDLVN